MSRREPTAAVPDGWPYTDEPTACAACGSDDDRYAVVDSLGLVWGGATDGGLAPTDLGDYVGTLAFRCCHDCWTREGVAALADARTLTRPDAVGAREAVALDDAKVAAAARLAADRVAVDTLHELDVRSAAEREHLRARDAAIEDALASWSRE
ncbi:hypothetical protein [Halorussus marinus]|uniref:hypothetical protein n=1 Tax=Halorussus marinus TaxID=2505976 RepID=UPI00106E21E1|nr:hypothetical protein [Halorussus marinus]